MSPGFHALWPTPLGIHDYPGAEDFNPVLARMLGALRLAQQQQRGAAPGAFFASDDDLLQRVKLPEWQAFVRFVVESLRDTVREANRHAWPADTAAAGMDLRIAIEGMWFQSSRDGAFHDLHTHGNCSWSGVYCVQVDDEPERIAHPVYGAAHGVTRFQGPRFQALAGAHVDLGNAYLQPPHIDIAPRPGRLVVFPSWLPHQALPYAGRAERLIVSFNASVHAASGSDRLQGYAPH
jgi:uncharacterized protein (TIGR02466 family)